MSTILKIVGYKSTSLSKQALTLASSSNLYNWGMSIEQLKNYLDIRISESSELYENIRMEENDNKLFVMEDGKTVSFIVERTKL